MNNVAITLLDVRGFSTKSKSPVKVEQRGGGGVPKGAITFFTKILKKLILDKFISAL